MFRAWEPSSAGTLGAMQAGPFSKWGQALRGKKQKQKQNCFQELAALDLHDNKQATCLMRNAVSDGVFPSHAFSFSGE